MLARCAGISVDLLNEIEYFYLCEYTFVFKFEYHYFFRLLTNMYSDTTTESTVSLVKEEQFCLYVIRSTKYLAPWSSVLLEKYQSLTFSRVYQNFMEPERSLTCSKEPAISPNSEPD
jgi:uncharacterized protein YqiB (DUF1249 family)